LPFYNVWVNLCSFILSLGLFFWFNLHHRMRIELLRRLKNHILHLEDCTCSLLNLNGLSFVGCIVVVRCLCWQLRGLGDWLFLINCCWWCGSQKRIRAFDSKLIMTSDLSTHLFYNSNSFDNTDYYRTSHSVTSKSVEP